MTKETKMKSCNFDYGPCTAPNTNCPHWIGTYCELDVVIENIKEEYKLQVDTYKEILK